MSDKVTMTEDQIRQMVEENQKLTKQLNSQSTGDVKFDRIVEFVVPKLDQYKSRKDLAKVLSETGLCSEKTGYHYLSLEQYVQARIRYDRKVNK